MVLFLRTLLLMLRIPVGNSHPKDAVRVQTPLGNGSLPGAVYFCDRTLHDYSSYLGGNATPRYCLWEYLQNPMGSYRNLDQRLSNDFVMDSHCVPTFMISRFV